MQLADMLDACKYFSKTPGIIVTSNLNQYLERDSDRE
jgi:hypothetical protein